METIDLSGSTVSGISPGLSGYLARPAGEGPWPALVVIFEAFGADDVNKRHVERLASMGYLALMPDLYSQGGARRCLISTFKALGQGRGRPFNDIEAARQWLVAAPDSTGSVGTVGFCMGGAFALATANKGFDAASANYGMLPRNLSGALDGACPIVASYPGKDASLKGKAAVLEAALTKAGVPHDVKEYPDAGHSFLNDAPNGPKLLRPILKRFGMGPEPTAAADAWQRIDAFFSEHLTR
jgi:carboxymethylenebutenolidase